MAIDTADLNPKLAEQGKTHLILPTRSSKRLGFQEVQAKQAWLNPT